MFVYVYINQISASLVAQMVKNACNTGDPGLIPGSGRSREKGNGNPLQYSCLDNFVDRRVWQATVVHGGHKELNTTEQLTLSLLHLFSHCPTLSSCCYCSAAKSCPTLYEPHELPHGRLPCHQWGLAINRRKWNSHPQAVKRTRRTKI